MKGHTLMNSRSGHFDEVQFRVTQQFRDELIKSALDSHNLCSFSATMKFNSKPLLPSTVVQPVFCPGQSSLVLYHLT